MNKPEINLNDHRSNYSHGSANAGDPPSSKLLLTETEAAKALGICQRTLWTLRNEGKIPFVRIGKCVRYSIETLKAWIADQDDNKPKNLPR
jgi:excisionase family DNA binding protein